MDDWSAIVGSLENQSIRHVCGLHVRADPKAAYDQVSHSVVPSVGKLTAVNPYHNRKWLLEIAFRLHHYEQSILLSSKLVGEVTVQV